MVNMRYRGLRIWIGLEWMRRHVDLLKRRRRRRERRAWHLCLICRRAYWGRVGLTYKIIIKIVILMKYSYRGKKRKKLDVYGEYSVHVTTFSVVVAVVSKV